MNADKTVIETVRELIKKQNMIEKGDRVLVAVSGGADSVCLLSILNFLAEELEITVFAAHLNHMLRGEEADSDEEYVNKLCKKMKIKLFAKRVDVKKVREDEGLTLEEAGRKARYDFFNEIKEKEKITKIATAHNRNDRAETVLMRIIRGTGLDGIRGIEYKRQDGVIRPLLDTDREDIEKYLGEQSIDYCTDRTNKDNDYTRNRVRNELIPYLKEKFNPSVVDSLIRFSDISGEDADFINGYAERLYERINNPMPSHKPYSLHIETFGMVEEAVKKRLIMITAKKAVGVDINLEYKHIKNIISITETDTELGIDLPGGLRVERQYEWLIFINKNEREIVKEDALFVKVMPLSSYFVESINKEITFKLVDPEIYKKNIREIMLDYDKLEGKELIMRSRLKGDRMVYFPDGKEKKIKKIFIDDKIPRADRDKIPLLCSDGEVADIIGSRVSEKYKVTKETKRGLVIEYGKD